jgi:hypothetical protein
VGCNAQAHGSKPRNLSVYLKLAKVLSLSYYLLFFLQQNWRTRGQNRFFLEAVGAGGRRSGGAGPNNAYTCK